MDKFNKWTKITNRTIVNGKVVEAGEFHEVNERDFKALINSDKAVESTKEERDNAIVKSLPVEIGQQASRESELKLKKRNK